MLHVKECRVKFNKKTWIYYRYLNQSRIKIRQQKFDVIFLCECCCRFIPCAKPCAASGQKT